VLNVPEHAAKQSGSEECTRKLTDPVQGNAPPGKDAAQSEGRRDGRVEVGAGDVADRIDHGHDEQAGCRRSRDRRHLTIDRSDDGATTVDHDQEESPEALGQEPLEDEWPRVGIGVRVDRV